MIERVARIPDPETGETMIYQMIRNGHGDLYQLVLVDTPEYGMEFIRLKQITEARQINPLLEEEPAEVDYEVLVA